MLITLRPFMSSVTFLYPMKTSEKQRFSNVFMGYTNVTLAFVDMKIKKIEKKY